jgi:hypothetical protein
MSLAADAVKFVKEAALKTVWSGKRGEPMTGLGELHGERSGYATEPIRDIGKRAIVAGPKTMSKGHRKAWAKMLNTTGEREAISKHWRPLRDIPGSLEWHSLHGSEK